MAEPTKLGSLDSEKLFDIQGFANFTAAHFVVKCHTVNAREGDMMGAMTLLPLKRGATGSEGAF